MFTWIKKWWAVLKRPSDPLFKRRPQAKSGFGAWVLVELGATDYVILMDTLHNIHGSQSTIEEKGREIMGLRYQALAMSLRTKGGKIPLDWRSGADLMWLAQFPYSETVPALQTIAKLSDIPWLNPVQQPKDQPVSDEEQMLLSDEEIAANP